MHSFQQSEQSLVLQSPFGGPNSNFLHGTGSPDKSFCAFGNFSKKSCAWVFCGCSSHHLRTALLSSSEKSNGGQGPIYLSKGHPSQVSTKCLHILTRSNMLAVRVSFSAFQELQSLCRKLINRLHLFRSIFLSIPRLLLH